MKRDSVPPPREAKQALRREMRLRLRELSPEARAEASLRLCQLAANLPEFIGAECVALFAPLPSEPDITPLVEEAWADGKRVLFPRMKLGAGKPTLEWFAVTDWDHFIEGEVFGLREPNAGRCELARADEIDCAFIPGLAFDEEGHRLGRGGGYYDVFLAAPHPGLTCIGVMLACQAMAKLPREAHDIRLNSVLTEDGLRRF